MTAAAASLPALELQFGQSANSIYEALLDLNIPADKLYASWQELMTLRGRILSMYGVEQPEIPAGLEARMGPPNGPVAPGMLGAGGGGFQGGMMYDWQTFDWKSKLNQAACLRAKRSMSKGELVYTVEPSPDSSGYVCTLTCAEGSGMLQGEHCSEAPAASKRQAEHMAAKVAVQAEFTEMYQAIVNAPWPPGGPGNTMAVPVAAQARGQKRKMGAMMAEWAGAEGWDQNEAKDGKSKLVHAAQLLLGRPVQKGDVVYETWSPEGEGAVQSGFLSTVTIQGTDGTAYEGQLSESKKAAESSAAEAALTALKETVDHLEEERRAKKTAEAKRKREEKKAGQAANKQATPPAALAEAVQPGGFAALAAGPVKAESN